MILTINKRTVDVIFVEELPRSSMTSENKVFVIKPLISQNVPR